MGIEGVAAIALAGGPAQAQEPLFGARQSTAVDFPSTLTFHLTAPSLRIEVQVRSLSPGVYSYALANEVDNLFDYGWTADYPDRQNFLDVLHSTSIDHNIGGYNHAEFDRLLDQARSEINHDQRTVALYRQAEQMLMDEAGTIPLFQGPDYVLTKSHVKGFAIGPFDIPLLQSTVIADRE